MDIVVTMPKADYEHLNEKGEGRGSYWEMRRRPKRLTKEDKVFVICGGKLTGYFTIDEIDDREFKEKYGPLYIIFGEWIPIKTIYMKGFQGFRYRKFGFKIV